MCATGETIGAEWMLLRAAFSVSLQDAVTRLETLLEEEEEEGRGEDTRMEEFLILLSGFQEVEERAGRGGQDR